ncbi:hypothetical protein [Crocosphaera chwakensis]|uniref:Uncharacterized protein n=1 Tax=Crocosphaera chwakensis CCY0110 TaxID=391612 RepID=A3J005_9CHRO|nr:hypothetical protein [Crocosphaera chwakensis]EAZ87943.1 hypothetical protein CY0110_00920 [Crocosphaera chwakensis CCY0110]
MSRGGKREGAGNKFKWKHGKTKTIRVPVELADQLLELAKKLDEGETVISQSEIKETANIDYDTESKVIDLTGISLVSVSGQVGVRLSDLMLKGYQIEPSRLADLVRRSFLKT